MDLVRRIGREGSSVGGATVDRDVKRVKTETIVRINGKRRLKEFRKSLDLERP